MQAMCRNLVFHSKAMGITTLQRGIFPSVMGHSSLEGLPKEPKKGGRSHTFALFVPLRSLARKKMRKLIWTS